MVTNQTPQAPRTKAKRDLRWLSGSGSGRRTCSSASTTWQQGSSECPGICQGWCCAPSGRDGLLVRHRCGWVGGAGRAGLLGSKDSPHKRKVPWGRVLAHRLLQRKVLREADWGHACHSWIHVQSSSTERPRTSSHRACKGTDQPQGAGQQPFHRHHLQGHARLLHSHTAKEARLRIESAATAVSGMSPERQRCVRNKPSGMSPVYTVWTFGNCHRTVTEPSQQAGALEV